MGQVLGSSRADGHVGVALGARQPGSARNQDGRPKMAPQEIDLVLPGFALSVRGQDGYTIVTISGELDIASVPVLREQILGMLRPQAGRIVIDPSGVDLLRCERAGRAAPAPASWTASCAWPLPHPWRPPFSASRALTRGSRSSPPCRTPSAHPFTGVLVKRMRRSREPADRLSSRPASSAREPRRTVTSDDEDLREAEITAGSAGYYATDLRLATLNVSGIAPGAPRVRG